jgi:hypothetical protein
MTFNEYMNETLGGPIGFPFGTWDNWLAHHKEHSDLGNSFYYAQVCVKHVQEYLKKCQEKGIQPIPINKEKKSIRIINAPRTIDNQSIS